MKNPYFPFPIDEFEMYVNALPNDQAKTALLYLTHFMTEGFRTGKDEWVKVCGICNSVKGPQHACIPAVLCEGCNDD
jgi:hypothetical protein